MVLDLPCNDFSKSAILTYERCMLTVVDDCNGTRRICLSQDMRVGPQFGRLNLYYKMYNRLRLHYASFIGRGSAKVGSRTNFIRARTLHW